MRSFLMSSVALAAMSATAIAADLPARYAAPVPAPVYAAPIFTWTGFYVGLNAGATFNNNDRGYPVASDALYNDYPTYVNAYYDAVGGYRRNNDDANFTGGAQIGYNWQFGSLVVGLEGDINWRGRGDRDDFSVLGAGQFSNYGVAYSGSRGSEWFATLRPRIGFAMDRTLLYVTGGLAYANTKNGGTLSGYDANTGNDIPGYTWTSRDNGSDWGWTLGGGVEHAFTNNWTAKLEYLYVNIDGGSNTLVNVSAPSDYTFHVKHDDSFHVVRVGLNYKFGGGASSAPVLARY